MAPRNHVLVVKLFLVFFIFGNAVDARHLVKRSTNRDFHAGYANADSREAVAAIAGQYHKNENNMRYQQQIGYASAGYDENSSVAKLEVGLHRSTGQVDNAMGAGSRRDGNFDTKFLSAGVETGHGVMGRASLVDASFNVGHVGIGMGIGLDTGYIVTNDGVEMKFKGIGGKISTSGFQLCIFFCFGINW